MLTADYLAHDPAYEDRYAVDVVSGPQTGPEGSLIEEVRRRGTPLTILPELVREISPAKDLQALIRLRQLMQDAAGRARYQIVHTHSSKAGVLGRVAARWAGVPIIVHTVHGWSFHDQMSPARRSLYVALERLGAALSQAEIVVTGRDIEKGLDAGIGRRQDYTVIRSGIELDRFGHPQAPPEEMKRQLGIPNGLPVVGSVTRLSPQKAPLDLVEAFRLICQQQPKSRFVVVGDGPMRVEMEMQLAAYGLAEQTVITGIRRDVPELMAMFDVFVLSSLWEGLPRVLPQAMATGLPVVCTRVDGAVEAVTEGETGFLVPRGEPALLAEKVVRLLRDEPLRRRMGEAGRARSRAFGARKMVAEIERLYHALLEKHTRR